MSDIAAELRPRRQVPSFRLDLRVLAGVLALAALLWGAFEISRRVRRDENGSAKAQTVWPLGADGKPAFVKVPGARDEPASIVWNPVGDTLDISVEKPQFFELGSGTPENLSVSFRQSPLLGGVGLYYGYRIAEKSGLPEFELVWLARGIDPDTRQDVLWIRHWTCRINESRGTMQAVRENAETRIDWPFDGESLRLTARFVNGKITSIIWNGERLQQVNLTGTVPAVPGQGFGLYVETGFVRFDHPNINTLKEQPK